MADAFINVPIDLYKTLHKTDIKASHLNVCIKPIPQLKIRLITKRIRLTSKLCIRLIAKLCIKMMLKQKTFIEASQKIHIEALV